MLKALKKVKKSEKQWDKEHFSGPLSQEWIAGRY